MKYRLPPQPHEWIDRTRPLKFTFEGRTYEGFAGDTITSALCAAGVRLLGRSFKYHRARGAYSLANWDVNVLVRDGKQINVRGDVTPLWNGAQLTPENTFGSLRRDWASLVDRFSKFLPVGFYYKAFHSPRSLFPFYERRMRQMAGLGAVDPKAARTHLAAKYDFCDLLVIGAGPAGLAAAIAGAETGLRVVVVDEQARAGGSLQYQSPADATVAALRERLLPQARAAPNLDLRTGTTAVGYYADHWIGLIHETGMVKMRARAGVLASGCFEQPAVFGNNDLPGVMLASAMQRLVHQFAVKPCNRAVVLTANIYGERAALDLLAAGVEIAAIVDLRPAGELSDDARALERAGVRRFAGHAVLSAVANGSKTGLTAVEVAPLDAQGQPIAAKSFAIACDGVAMSVGWAAADGLFYQAGGRMTWSEELQQFVPNRAPAGLFAAGRLNGVYGLEEQVLDGRRAGFSAAAFLDRYSGELPTPAARPTVSPSHAYPVYPSVVHKSFVDLDEDVHYKDIVNGAQEGFDQVELLKRYSTFGMGPSQGKLANINAIRILAHAKGQTVPETGVTTSRPFFHPVTLAALAGRSFHPHRRTPLHERHAQIGAVFLPAGEWQRPAYYARPNLNARQAIAEEVQAVRQRVGMIDVGTLGKIEVSGPDAGEFLERIYTGRFAKMKVGTTRYAVMCDESGVIIDDGLVGRLGEDRFYATTTTSAAGPAYREMQRWAILWGMNVTLAAVTGHYGAINVAGPAARDVLKQLCSFDLSEAAFPYLALREGSIADLPARFLRVGFVGEWGCEIHLPAYGARRAWDALAAAGAAHGLLPFGVEAQRVLRLEKAHVIVSQDTDGLTNPFEANMAWAIKDDKPFFIGQRSLRVVRAKPLARLLVGFALDANYVAAGKQIPKECHLVIDGDAIIGRVTSITPSATLNRVIGLVYLPPDRAKVGQQFQIRLDDGSYAPASVVETPFYDPTAARQTGKS